MAVEKFIRGKRDNGKHDGLAANRRRLQAAEYDQGVYEQLYVSTVVYRQRSVLPAEMVAYHEGILRAWGVLPEIPGKGQELPGIPVEGDLPRSGQIYPLDTEGKK